jgi:sugar (pentulose or hexulose) kinase
MDTAPSNHGRVMLPYFQPEITPLVLDAGVQRYGGLDPGDTEGNIRAVAEAQVMSMYLHSGWAGELPQKILVTAGGSTNKGLLRLIAQVFGAKVRVHDVADSAALGAALRAATVDQADISLEELARNWLGVLDREVVQAAPEETEVFKDLSDCCMFMPRARHITYLTGLRRKKPLQLFSRALDRKGYRRHPEYGPVFGMNN